MPDTPTAADLRAMAEFNNLSLRQRAALRAGADAMDERDRQRADRAALTVALAGLRYKDEPGRFCDHAAAPCTRCDRAAAALAEHGGERPAAVDDTLPKLSEMKGAFRDGAE